MSDLNIFTEGTQKDILNELKVQTSLVKVLASGWTINDWAAVQEIVRGGGGKRYFPVGTQFSVTHSEYGNGNIIFDVTGHNIHKKPNYPDAPTMTLTMRHAIYGRQFDAPEWFWANTTGSPLVAGTYNFTLYKASNNSGDGENGTYQFTIAQSIPVNGGLRHTSIGLYKSSAADYKPENITNGTITSYSADGTSIETGITVAAGTEGTSLGTDSVAKANCANTVGSFNSSQRNAYGSGNYGESAIRKWLSSDAESGWWAKQTPFDMPPSYASAAGFLHGIDPAFAAVLGEVDITTARNTMYETGDTLGGSYTTRDKIFLLSMTELGFGTNNSIAEGVVLPYYEDATQVDRIKYDIGNQTTARYWWVRSPYPWGAHHARSVTPEGALGAYGASDGRGAVAACVIY